MSFKCIKTHGQFEHVDNCTPLPRALVMACTSFLTNMFDTHDWLPLHIFIIWFLCLHSSPKLNNYYSFYFSYCSQRTWLLKLLAVELYAGDVSRSTDLEACHSILEYLFGHENVENNVAHAGTPQIVTNSKVLLIA